MLLRPITTERAKAELRYVKEMGLNTIRLEGKLETDEFYDLADQEGILIMPGWCCCDQWEMWDKWDAEDHRVGAGVAPRPDPAPAQPPERARLAQRQRLPAAARRREGVPRRAREAASGASPCCRTPPTRPGKLSGPTGVKMRGPYDYVPPSYWLTDTKNGGAFGFATEMGPGGAVPPIESLKKMLPAEHLWPIDEFWKFHAGGDEFKDLNLFTGALEGRYGKATSAEDYARKAQALAYENHRAMFEAYGRNKYTSTGVIQWMLNNAWPSMIWHLYDYYLRPGGSYFGSKKAGEPLHVQYSYDDRSIAVVNDLQEAFKGLKVKAEVFDLDLAPKFSQEATVDVAPDGVVRALTIPAKIAGPGHDLLRAAGAPRRERRAAQPELLLAVDEGRRARLEEHQVVLHARPSSHADLTALAKLPPTTLAVSARPAPGPEAASLVTVENTGKALAFQVRLKMVDPTSGEERLPVFWDDNYFELFPGEKREIRVAHSGPSAAPLSVTASAWNAGPTR